MSGPNSTGELCQPPTSSLTSPDPIVDRSATDPVVRQENCCELLRNPGNRGSPPFRMSGLLVKRWM